MSRRAEYDSYFTDKDGPSLSIDGRDWAYRDPNNQAKIDRDMAGDDNYYGFKGTGKGNEDSYEFTNPLFKYTEGDVTDVASGLGINNVDEPEEVEQILEGLRNRGFGANASDETAIKEPSIDPITITHNFGFDGKGTKEDYEAGIQDKKNSIKEYENASTTVGDRFFPGSDANDFASAYKNKVMSGLQKANIATRGPGSGFNGEGF